jgi:hypothetical protein
VGAAVSWILMQSHERGMAIAILLFSVYIFIIFASALITYRINRQHPST